MLWLEITVVVLLLVGAIFVLLGSVALVKFPDFYCRLHGPTKASTVGIGSLVLASLLFFNFLQQQLTLQHMLIGIFLMISAPVTAHLLMKAALHQQVKLAAKTQNSQLTLQQSTSKKL